MNWLKGKKTYIVMGLGVLTGVVLIVCGDVPQGIQTILGALGLGALRAGVSKVAAK